MTVTTTIVRPRWAGGRPNPANKAAIAKAEELIKKHEEKHRDIARAHAARAVKQMKGKTEKQADTVLAKILKEYDSAQKALDASEGMMSVVEKDGGATIDIIIGPVKKTK
jgi:predicted secreted Zn-dependent protease